MRTHHLSLESFGVTRRRKTKEGENSRGNALGSTTRQRWDQQQGWDGKGDKGRVFQKLGWGKHAFLHNCASLSLLERPQKRTEFAILIDKGVPPQFLINWDYIPSIKFSRGVPYFLKITYPGLDLLAWSSSWRNLANGEACLAALALPPGPGEGRGDCEVLKPDGEFGELLKLFGDAGEARGEHGGDPIARRRPALPEMDRKH